MNPQVTPMPQNSSPLRRFIHHRRRVLIFALLALLLASVLAALVAVGVLQYLRTRPVTLPEPGGAYPVGRTVLAWQDSRPDLLADGAPRPRQMLVWVWYPTDTSTGSPAPYLPDAWVRAHLAQAGLGLLLQQDPTRIYSHAVAAEPEQVRLSAKQASYPLLIFAPGYGPSAPDYTALAEDLASRGYIVAAITPVESASLAVLPDGARQEPHVIARSQAGSLPDNSGAELEQAGNRLVSTWSADMRSALDEMARLNGTNGPWSGRVDLNRVGFFGHSFGGAASADACRVDQRCKAGADLDGSLFGPAAQPGSGLNVPFLFIWSETSSPEAQAGSLQARPVYDSLPKGSGWQELPGARHFNFLDSALGFNPLLHVMDMLGPADPIQTLQTVRADLADFFDRVHAKDVRRPRGEPPDAGIKPAIGR